MEYRVEFTPQAREDLDRIYRWAADNAPYRGPLWFERFEIAILSLRVSPERCMIVPKLSTPKANVRQLVFGKRRHRYDVYFAIFGDVVRILHVRHGARAKPEEVLT